MSDLDAAPKKRKPAVRKKRKVLPNLMPKYKVPEIPKLSILQLGNLRPTPPVPRPAKPKSKRIPTRGHQKRETLPMSHTLPPSRSDKPEPRVRRRPRRGLQALPAATATEADRPVVAVRLVIYEQRYGLRRWYRQWLGHYLITPGGKIDPISLRLRHQVKLRKALAQSLRRPDLRRLQRQARFHKQHIAAKDLRLVRALTRALERQRFEVQAVYVRPKATRKGSKR